MDLSVEKMPVKFVSQEIQDIVSIKPHWIIRLGTTFLFLLIFVMITATWFIKYPDLIKAPMRLVALNAPKLIATKANGKLLKLLVSDGSLVKQGQPIAWLSSTADHNQVLSMYQWIIQAQICVEQKNKIEQLLRIPIPFYSQLGELQISFQAFQSSFQQMRGILGNGYYQKKQEAIQVDLQYAVLQKKAIEQQRILYLNDLKLQKIEYQAKETLLHEKVIAPLEFNQEKSKLIAKQQSLEQLSVQAYAASVSRNSKETELIELHRRISDQKLLFLSDLLDLKSKAEDWMERYILSASQEGILQYVSSLEENQQIHLSEELFYISSHQAKYYGEVLAPQQGLGKIKKNQRVIIHLESFPSSEFGSLNGVVNSISSIPNKEGEFLIKIHLTNGLITTHHKRLLFRNNLSGTAEVVTDDSRLITKLLIRFKELVKH